MSILDVPAPQAPFSIIVAEHRIHPTRHYLPAERVIWFTIRPEQHLRLVIMDGYKREAAAVVTIHF